VSETGDLIVEDLDVRYGPAQALFGVSASAGGGRVLAVLGANGAGKSTLGRAVAGLVPVTSGRVRFDGQDITGWAPHRVRRAGLAYIPEGRGVFPGLSVMENLRMAAGQLDGRTARREAIARAVDLFPVLGQREHQRAGSLSGGEQQMLALARAIAVKPRLIVADEMSLGLAPIMVNAVFDSLGKARQEGITIVLIEQFVHRALAFADDCLVLSRGVVSWAGPAKDAGQEVLDRYLGEATTAVAELS
jgi:branched-chain amino acid transport system ATP-binding protein